MSSFQERLLRAIPGGAHTYSRGFDQFPTNAPQILTHGEGANVWDPAGNKYLDYGMALRSVTLGYSDSRVNAAAYRQIELGNNLTRASTTELEAAELLIDLVPSIEMVKFAKNGSNVTTAAVKMARAYTGRKFVCVPRQQPFFTFDDWFIGTTVMDKGILTENKVHTLVFDYGNISTLHSLFEAHPGQIAAVLLEPATTITPCPSSCSPTFTADSPCLICPNLPGNFLHQVQELCRQEGALFILDEMITGFRWHLQGASAYFGVEPDLTTFGKAMANGFSVAALGGRREVMQLGSIEYPGSERTFLLSSTHGGEMSSLGAFMETVAIYEESDVVQRLWSYGQKLKNGLEQVAKSTSTDHLFSVEGPAICLNYVLRESDGVISSPLRTLFSQEMVRNGVLMPWISVSLAHGDNSLNQTLEAAQKSLQIVAMAAERGVEHYLEGSPIKPVFRKFN